LGEKTDREPSLRASAIYALLLTMVLLNPNDIAPCIVNSIGMIPAWDTFRLLVSQDAGLAGPAETDSASKKLLDYLLVLGSSIFVEQLLRNTTVSRVMPFWWIMKVAVVLWFLMGSAKHEMPGVEVSTCMSLTSYGSSGLTETDGNLARAGIDPEKRYLGDEHHRTVSRTWTSVPQERPADSRPRSAVPKRTRRVHAGDLAD
jgi:hypothetical protein